MQQLFEKDKYIFQFKACTDYLYNSLLANRFFFSSIKDFNDPFESLFKIKSWNRDLEGENHFYRSIFPNTVLRDIPIGKHDSIISQRRDPKLSDIYLMEDLNQTVRSFISSFYGVVSFSHCYKELLMWSHYAKAGSGVCLFFDRNEIFTNQSQRNIFIQDVDYKDDLPSIDIRLISNQIMCDIRPILTRKRTNWAYEQEIRAFLNLSKANENISLEHQRLNGDQKSERTLEFNPDAFKGLIFGHNCSPYHRNKVLEQIKGNPNIEFNKLIFYEAKINENTGQYFFRKLNELAH